VVHAGLLLHHLVVLLEVLHRPEDHLVRVFRGIHDNEPHDFAGVHRNLRGENSKSRISTTMFLCALSGSAARPNAVSAAFE